ncbi:hypothetical protein [Halolamina salifodinae]|uniref:Uncharacterized protein n=1 Tax=Halolamina salifodinae TaxID=1202767 RepID=A0A8T4GV03_9EURY|nr:hypothetical protein [Halolamina salifodinae]MBP1986230.1 hypothetical protein [Halolamina salifodinae]
MSHILIAQTVVLVAVSLAVLYPVVAYARTLLYTEAVAMLAASLLVFSAGSLVEEGLGMVTPAEGVYLLSALCFAGAAWLFAREFIRIDSGGFDADDATPGASPGFAEAADTDGIEGGFGATTEGEDGE